MKTPKQKRLRPGNAAKPAKKSGVKTQAAQSQGIASKSLKARPGKVRPTKLRPGKLKPTKRPGPKKPSKPTVIKGDLERVTPDTLREVLNGGGGKIRDRKTREILPKIELDRLRPGIGLPLPKPKGNGSLFETLSAKVPLTLFPVRLETVFDREGKRRTLKIRVYPDDIHIDDHDPRLSPEERDLGQTFWSRMAKAKGDEALQTQICTWLIDSLSEKRAAFVAEATRKGAEPPKINKASGRQPARARCLPKFWKAVGYRRKGDGTLEEVFSVKGHAIPKTLCVDPLLGEMDHATTPAGRTALWMSDFQAAVTVGMGIEVDVTDLSWLDRDGLAMLMVYGVRGTASQAQSSEMQHLMQAHRFSSGLAFQAQGAVLNALSLGEALPAELRHARTDISKSELEHRVLLALPELTDKVARKGAPGRLLTHPGLDAYVTPMLPDLSTLGVDVISGDTVHRVPLLTMMKELEFSALDLICEAARPGALGRHAMAALIATGEVLLPETHVPTALGAESETGPRVSADLEEFEELAHELSAHLGALRPARPSDFGLLETGEGDMVLGASLVARLKALALRSKTRAEALKTSAEDISRLLPLLSLLSREGLPEALCGPDVIFAQDRTVFAGHLERPWYCACRPRAGRRAGGGLDGARDMDRGPETVGGCPSGAGTADLGRQIAIWGNARVHPAL